MSHSIPGMIWSLCSGPRMPFMTARTLYGVQVSMKTSRMADRVLAAFRSCLFSWVAFFSLFFRGSEAAGVEDVAWLTLLTYLAIQTNNKSAANSRN